MTLLEAAKQALDYIKDIQDHCACEGIECEKEEGLVEALRQAIEQAEKQEPYCWVQSKLVQGTFYKEKPRRIHTIPLYAALPQTKEST